MLFSSLTFPSYAGDLPSSARDKKQAVVTFVAIHCLSLVQELTYLESFIKFAQNWITGSKLTAGQNQETKHVDCFLRKLGKCSPYHKGIFS